MGRRKNRWILAKVDIQDRGGEGDVAARVLTRESVETEVVRLCGVLYGSIGGGFVAEATNVVLVNEAESLVLLQTKRNFLSKVVCVLRCLGRLQKVAVAVEVVHIGGTLHQCKKLLFSSLLKTLSQLQALTLGQGTPKQAHTQRAIAGINEVHNLKNPTAL